MIRRSPQFPVFLFVLASAVSALVQAAESPARERISLNQDWRFIKGDPAGVDGASLKYEKLKPWLLPSANDFRLEHAVRPSEPEPGKDVPFAQPGFDDKSWRALNLPHDWAIEGPFQQSLPGETGKLPYAGIAWYRKHFSVPTSDHGRKIYLDVDGAMARAAVWCNGRFVGGWPYGYASWQLDLTPFLNLGGENVLAIRLENPDDSSRWYPGAGIYRNVWIEKTSPVHVAHWGTAITTPVITQEEATVHFRARTELPTQTAVRATIAIFQADPAGKPTGNAVATFPQNGTAELPASGCLETDLALAHPKLWNLESPNRYVAVLSLSQDDRLVDRHETVFGVRQAEFTANDGFHLNGKRVQIRGVCLHHDFGALGTGFNLRAAQRILETMREMGVNAVRCSHNPPAPEWLDLCDQQGFLVMDELVDTWRRAKKPNDYHVLFPDWSEADLRALVRRDRNHPCVIMWSMGNELDDQSLPDGPQVAKKMARFAKMEDSSRPVTIANSDGKAGFNGFQIPLDVFGYNYKPFLYKKFRETNPDQPIYGSETSSTVSTRGEYGFPLKEGKDTDGRIGFQMTSYDLNRASWATLPDAEFRGQEENPFVAGEFVWTGFDYLGEPTPFNSDITNVLNYHTPEERAQAEAELKALGKIRVPSRSSYFGIVDLAGFKKDRFYFYQAHWRPELPMAHILPHWNWPERVGQVTPVFVYTSGDEAELFLNGKSLGRKKKGQYEYRLRWDEVQYEPGELKVVAYKEGKEWASSSVKTTGTASKLIVTPDRSRIQADGKDLSFVTITVVDKDGLMVPRSKPLLKFTVEGPGELAAADNGDPTDLTVFSSPERKSFNGLAMAIIRAKPGAKSPITLRVSGEGLPETVTTITPIP